MMTHSLNNFDSSYLEIAFFACGYSTNRDPMIGFLDGTDCYVDYTFA